MKMKSKKVWIFGIAGLVVMSFAVVFATVGFSETIAHVREGMIARTPDAILASAGLDGDKSVKLPVSYYDQRADGCVNLYDVSLRKELYARQFEWASCGYKNQKLEQGMVDFVLDENYLPVAIGGKFMPNRGLRDMGRWFTEVEGKSKYYAGTIEMNYDPNKVEFWYSSDEFYPLDGAEFSNGDFVSGDGHNHLFTVNFAVPFTAFLNGEEEFEIRADDDTFVFVDNDLVIDMGGIHDATTGKMRINEKGEIYAAILDEDLAFTGVSVNAGAGAMIRIFHADRDAKNSVFDMRLKGFNVSVLNSEIANGDGVQVAYDPNDPSYIAPLGVSEVFSLDNTKGYAVMATIYGVLIMASAVFMLILVKYMIRQKQEQNNK